MDNNRLNHINKVAKIMYDYSLYLKRNIEYSKEMYVLGFLHDVGYEFGNNLTHADLGADILKKTGYKYYQEIKNHGKFDVSYSSFELKLLNFVDMHVNSCGDIVSFEERRKDIALRYGEESSQILDFTKLMDTFLNDFTFNEDIFLKLFKN